MLTVSTHGATDGVRRQIDELEANARPGTAGAQPRISVAGRARRHESGRRMRGCAEKTRSRRSSRSSRRGSASPGVCRRRSCSEPERVRERPRRQLSDLERATSSGLQASGRARAATARAQAEAEDRVEVGGAGTTSPRGSRIPRRESRCLGSAQGQDSQIARDRLEQRPTRCRPGLSGRPTTRMGRRSRHVQHHPAGTAVRRDAARAGAVGAQSDRVLLDHVRDHRPRLAEHQPLLARNHVRRIRDGPPGHGRARRRESAAEGGHGPGSSSPASSSIASCVIVFLDTGMSALALLYVIGAYAVALWSHHRGRGVLACP